MSAKKTKTLCYSGWLKTVTGIKLDIFNPNPKDIRVGDIAHSLSMLCRFNGHCPKFYSVAQHSVIVSNLVKPEFALEGLCHDFSEALLGDFVRPIKKYLPDYIAMEHQVEKCFAKAFKLKTNKSCKKNVKWADNVALVTEVRDLLEHEDCLSEYCPDVEPMKEKIRPLSQKKSYELFLERFFELTGLQDA